MDILENPSRDTRDTRVMLESLWLELTQKCNLHCSHCYAASHVGLPIRGQMDDDDWLDVIGQGGDLGCKFVQFIGGEPLLHPSAEKFAVAARNAGIRQIEILCNATVLTDAMLAWMVDLEVEVSTSVYAPEPSGHDAVTGRIGSWTKTIRNVDRMLEAGLPVRAGIIYRDWDDDEVPKTAALLEGMGVVVGTDRVRSIGRGGTTSSPPEYLNELCGACGAKRLCVTNTGDVYPCIMSRQTVLGNIKSDPLLSMIRGEPLKAFTTALGMTKAQNSGNCTPDCFPHGGCAPHDICKPHKAAAPDQEVGF